jgi:hypothetical protein
MTVKELIIALLELQKGPFDSVPILERIVVMRRMTSEGWTNEAEADEVTVNKSGDVEIHFPGL